MPLAFKENLLTPPLAGGRRRPESFAGEGAEAPANTEIARVAEDTLSALKYSFAAVAAGEGKSARAGSVEADIERYLTSLPKARQATLRERGATLVGAAPETRAALFGRFGKLSAAEMVASGAERVDELLGATPIDRAGLGLKVPSLTVPVTVLTAVDGKVVIPTSELGPFSDLESAEELTAAVAAARATAARASVYNAERLADLYGLAPQLADDLGEGDLEGQAVLDRLTLEVREVKCIDETNPEWPGDDEIAIGGNSIDEDGDVKVIAERRVADNFDDGESRLYSPYLTFESFNLKEGKSWPKKYTVVMLLAEKDSGGFGALLSSIYQKVKDKLKNKLGLIIGSALEAVLGSTIAQAIADAAAWIVDQLISWLISLFSDDVFPPATLTLRHASLDARFTINGQWGYPFSAWYYANFKGFGGHYRVTYRWRLST